MSTPAREAGSAPGHSKVMVPLGELALGELALELGRLGDLAQRLLAVHVPDRHGRCRGCTAPGTGLPDAKWPCALHFYATAAAQAVA